MDRHTLAFVCSLVLLLGMSSAVAQGVEKPSVFDLPRIRASQAATRRAVTALLSKGEYAKAEQLLKQAVQRLPHDPFVHYNLACALSRQGKTEAALASLSEAITRGFRNAGHIEADDDLKSLRDQDQFKELLKKAAEPAEANPSPWKYKVTPGEIADGQVVVTESNTAFVPQAGLFHAIFKLNRELTKDKPIVQGMGEVGKLLSKWYAEKTAAGHHGDLYDNHDKDHSNMNYKAFPQLTRIEYSEAAKKRGYHNGLQRFFLFNGVTIGNSSTALTSGPYWRSQGRFVLSRPNGARLLYMQYIRNHLYFYPEHRDHDPGHNNNSSNNNKGAKGYGDLYKVNTPYLIISQGSSGSDRAFINAVAATLAAFRPKVKEQLAKQGLISPTVQMIFRMSNKTVAKAADYLTDKAHPSVFDGKQINTLKMIKMAHAMTPDVFPPMVQLKVVKEDQPVLGRDYFDIAPREHFLNSPCAIGRIVKGSAYTRRMTVSAASSVDAKGKPLTYHWKVLRGDADRIKINKLDDAGATVELVVPYHERRPIKHGSDMASNRVDIGVFVHNGTYYSAPAFVSFYYLDNEKRQYDEQGNVRMIDYTDPVKSKNYVDPLIDFKKDWRDEYLYGDDGEPAGWKRFRGQEEQRFTADGKLVTESGKGGEPIKTVNVRYVAKREGNKLPRLIQQVVEE